MTNNHHHPILPLVLELLPYASAEELEQAQENYEGFLNILVRIYKRLEREGKLPGRQRP